MESIVFLLFLTITTIAPAPATATTDIETTPHHYCNSDEHSATSGMGDVQQPTTLQYCLIDNCTIMRIDTGQQLDIVYTTQSHIIVTTTNGQTSLLIPKNEPELSCVTYNPKVQLVILQLITMTLTALVSGCIITVHLIFKELRSIFGKLIIFYNIASIGFSIASNTLIMMSYKTPVYSITFCYLIAFSTMQLQVVGEGFATCISAYIAYIMYQSCHYREVTKAFNKKFYKCSIIYVLGLLLLFDIFIVGYDFGTGTYKHVTLPNGHCTYFDRPDYDTFTIFYATTSLSKIIQVLMFVVCFVYYYKVKKMLKRHDKKNDDMEQNQLLFKIALTMGATIGISRFALLLDKVIDTDFILVSAGLISLLVQQCAIMFLFMCSKKMSQLCKEKFSAIKVTPQNVTSVTEQYTRQ